MNCRKHDKNLAEIEIRSAGVCHAMRDLPLRGINFDSLWLQGCNNGGIPKGIPPLLARHEGFEPPAFWSVARRSIQLS